MYEVLSLLDLMNHDHDDVDGRYLDGEEQQDSERFKKLDLVFLSGEKFPRYSVDPDYRDNARK